MPTPTTGSAARIAAAFDLAARASSSVEILDVAMIDPHVTMQDRSSTCQGQQRVGVSQRLAVAAADVAASEEEGDRRAAVGADNEGAAVAAGAGGFLAGAFDLDLVAILP